jgi:hypothetical protein
MLITGPLSHVFKKFESSNLFHIFKGFTLISIENFYLVEKEDPKKSSKLLKICDEFVKKCDSLKKLVGIREIMSLTVTVCNIYLFLNFQGRQRGW